MISVIINSRDDERFARVEPIYARLLAEESHEIVRVADARSMAEGYNRGIARSRGDVLLFSHDDIEILSPNFVARLRGHLDHADLIGVAGADHAMYPAWHVVGHPHVFGMVAHAGPEVPNAAREYVIDIFCAPAPCIGGMKLLDGVFMACRRTLAEQLRFDEDIPGFHVYDADFSFRAYQAGLRVAVATDLHLVHWSAGQFGGPEWKQSAAVFMRKHAGELDTSFQRRW